MVHHLLLVEGYFNTDFNYVLHLVHGIICWFIFDFWINDWLPVISGPVFCEDVNPRFMSDS